MVKMKLGDRWVIATEGRTTVVRNRKNLCMRYLVFMMELGKSHGVQWDLTRYVLALARARGGKNKGNIGGRKPEVQPSDRTWALNSSPERHEMRVG